MSLPRNRGKTSGRSGCRAGSADEFREVGDGSVSGDIEPGTELIPEGDGELGAGFGEAEEGILQSRPVSLRVPPLILRLVRWQRMSFSEPLVWSGISGRSSTISNSGLLAWSLASSRSRISKPVRRRKIQSNLARKAAL